MSDAAREDLSLGFGSIVALLESFVVATSPAGRRRRFALNSSSATPMGMRRRCIPTTPFLDSGGHLFCYPTYQALARE
jgi:hypothetical protein